MEDQQLLIVGKNENELKKVGEQLKYQYDIIYSHDVNETKELLKISLMLFSIIIDIDDFDEDFEIIHFLKQYPRLSLLPFFILGRKDHELEMQSCEYGAIDYIQKPYHIQSIVHHLEHVHRLYKNNTCRDLTVRDTLTKVYNKEFFLEEAQNIINDNPQIDYDLICFDINRFKLINDLYGIAGGDKLLEYVSHLYLDVVRENHWIMGRLHNDVFVILMERGSMSYDDLIRIITKRLEFVKVPVKIVLNFGIYHIIDRRITMSVMCDRALMASKSLKGNYETSYQIYQEELRQNIIDEQTMINEMEHALVDHQFIPYYQPKYHIETGHVIGFEALVRWNHPQKGIIPPFQFIPLFEANGFISKVDYCIWEQVCQDLRHLIDKGYDVLPVSVNVSRIELYMNIEEKLTELMNRYELPIDLLKLEITETAYTKDPQQLIEVVESLRKKGFSILMDDFGSGYSSLNMLKEVPVDVLKIDLRFLHDLQTTGKSEKILESVVIMARKLGLSVIAEGVETKYQVSFLRSIGCLRVQGYYYSRPICQEDFYAMYEDSSVVMGDTKDTIETLINVDDVLNNVHRVDDVEWYRGALLRLDAQIFEYDFLTGSMRYYDNRIVPQSGKLSKIEIPNYKEKIKQGYHVHPDDVDTVLDILSGKLETKERIRMKPFFSHYGYQWHDVITHTIVDDHNKPIVAVGVLRHISEYKLNELLLFVLSCLDTHKNCYQVIDKVWAYIGKELYFDYVYAVIRNQPQVEYYHHYSNDDKPLPKLTSLSKSQRQQLSLYYHDHKDILILQAHCLDEYDEIFKEYFTTDIETVILIPIYRNHHYVGETVLSLKEYRELSEAERNVLIEIGKYINHYMDNHFFEIQLQEMNSLYNVMVDNMYNGVLMLEIQDNDIKGIFANKVFYHLYGYDENEDITSIDVMALLVDEERQMIKDVLLKAIETNKLQSCHYHGKSQDGKILNLEMKAQCVESMQGDYPIVLVMIDNISEKVYYEKESELMESRYLYTLDKTHAGLWDYNIKTRELYCSQDVFGNTKKPQVIQDVPYYFIRHKIIHADYVKGYIDFYQKVSSGQDCDYIFKILQNDGIDKWVHITYHVLFDEHGQPERAIGFGEIVNELYENKIKIQREQYYEAVIHGTRVYYDINLTANSIVYNDERLAFLDMKDYTYTRFLEFVLKNIVTKEDRKDFIKHFSIDNMMNFYKNGKTFFTKEYRLGIDKKRWYEIDVNFYTPDQSQDICAFITGRDIEERKQYELSLEFKAEHDDLTGLYTREAITNYVNKIIDHKEIAMLMIDVDDFKMINDTFGHVFGDDTLKNIADVLTQVVREKGIVGRMGGDEFIAVIEDFYSEQEIIDMIRRINESIHLTYTSNGVERTLSCSIGVAYSQKDIHSFKELYDQADQRLYYMKKVMKID